MGTCEKCGAATRPGAEFCTSCGAPITASEGQQAQGGALPPVPPGGQLQPGGPAAGIPPLPPYAAPAKKGMSKGLKIFLVIAACVVLLIIVGIVVGAIFIVKVVSAPADVSNNYVKAINEGNLTLAYSYLAASTRKGETLSGFRSKLSPLSGHISKYNTSSASISAQTGRPSTAQVVMNLSFDDGSKATWDMNLAQENGHWKILSVKPS